MIVLVSFVSLPVTIIRVAFCCIHSLFFNCEYLENCTSLKAELFLKDKGTKIFKKQNKTKNYRIFDLAFLQHGLVLVKPKKGLTRQTWENFNLIFYTKRIAKRALSIE